ncbi:hypothetical protein OSB04_019720 [Centaurea solstitialis]|uniref:F-box domain-containing protein n=1 Tax=Centaurea solstitialis TaxID=347529 RepID=A0AA38W363_9ASTR|nr:hypothetical protein OSB04_019720 [Centaurea solstitialis]
MSIQGKKMDVVHDDRASIIAKEDRISNLPDDIIHRILSFIDMKYVVQTSALSKRWKHVWISMPYLNLDSYEFRTLPQFAKFVKHVISHRNHHSEVSSVKLQCTGATTQFAVKSIVDYAYSHNVRHLTVNWFTKKDIEFPQYLFRSHTLKHLTLATSTPKPKSYKYAWGHLGYWIPNSALDFPALETLKLSNMQLCDITDTRLDLFSKCVNLKDLTLERISMADLDIFNVCAPQLCNLTVTYPKAYPKVFNVVAPQLKNLIVSSWASCSLQLSKESLDSLEKVKLSMSFYGYRKQRNILELLDLFQKLRSAKSLILNMDIIEVYTNVDALSSCPDQLALEPCPFNNLKFLKIHKQEHLMATIPTHVRNYFLESSPGATFIMDLPQVAWKRSREEVDEETMANKVAKLEEEKHMQDEVIAQQKAMLEAMKLQQEKMMSQVINWKMVKLQVQVAGGNPDFELIRSMGRDIKSIMELAHESLRVVAEAQLSCQLKEVKRLFLTSIDASQWAKIEMEIGSTGHSERINFDNMDSQFDVPSAALPQLP